MLSARLIFNKLPLDSDSAASTQAAIELMVVLLTVRLVVQNVKLGRGKGVRTSGTDKASLVIPPSQPPIGGRNTFSGNGLATSLAVTTGRKLKIFGSFKVSRGLARRFSRSGLRLSKR